MLQPALSRGTHDPQLMTVAGEAYLAVGDVPKAAQYFSQTAALDPKNAAARTRLGQVRFAEGDDRGCDSRPRGRVGHGSERITG